MKKTMVEAYAENEAAGLHAPKPAPPEVKLKRGQVLWGCPYCFTRFGGHKTEETPCPNCGKRAMRARRRQDQKPKT